jgi:type II secretory pathway pseudopilin PulG
MNLAGQGTGLIRLQNAGCNGYAMAALLVGISVMSVLMSMALPVWSHMVKREKEAELIWRGEQYKRAIMLFQRKYANTFPPTLDVLLEQKFLRKKYKDPITNDDFQLLPASGGGPQPGSVQGVAPGGGRQGTPPQSGFSGRGTVLRGGGTAGPQVQIVGAGTVNLGIGGVVSKSKDASIKIYNGRQKYNEWVFVHVQTSQRIGGPAGGQFPGMPMQPGRGGRGMPPGVGGPDGRGGFPGGRGMPSGRPPVPFGLPGQQPPQRPPGV